MPETSTDTADYTIFEIESFTLDGARLQRTVYDERVLKEWSVSQLRDLQERLIWEVVELEELIRERTDYDEPMAAATVYAPTLTFELSQSEADSRAIITAAAAEACIRFFEGDGDFRHRPL